nr:imidazole glycerol phosphate synthase subunit HisH [Nitrospirota bacterium]
MPDSSCQVAIVDYGLGNLFSVQHACERAGLKAHITNSKKDILSAAAVILPGVGAFGTAMDALRELDLVEPLRDVVASRTPLVGICLGMQLLLSESHEFGKHKGLGIIEGEVVHLQGSADGRCFKVPQVGWNRIHSAGRGWEGSFLEGLAEGEFMYFVHSFYCKPADPGVVAATTRYGALEFCASLRRRTVFACQFHPERSGCEGLKVYRNLAAMINGAQAKEHDVREVGSQIRTA